jgi:L-aspartate oxidase
MWQSTGLFRTRTGLEHAVARLEGIYAEAGEAAAAPDAGTAAWQRFSLSSVARLIARAALRREESRGAHYREDFSARDDLHWKIHVTDQRDNYGQE